MHRSFALLAGAAAALAVLVPRDARACGGCFHEPPNPGEVESVITDHRMILTISPQQTTLYDEIRYQGSPASFAWVLPVSGTATVGLSADGVFGALDSVTQTKIEAPPPPVCSGPPLGDCAGDFGGAATPSAADAAAAPPPVTVVKQQVVGPYETVQLHSSDPNALDTWLTSHNFVIPADVQPIISAYVQGGFDFLAMKLVPGAGVQAMRPVRVTTPGASPVLPLRMVAAGTGATVSITLWVVGQGNWEPQNFPFFTIDTSEITWDYQTSSSNYAMLRQQKENALGGRGWQVESAIDVSPAQVENALLRSEGGFVTGGFDGSVYGGDAAVDYDPQPGPDGGPGETPDQVRADDLAALFNGAGATARITRMRADLAHAALSADLVLQASANQAVIPNYHYTTNVVNTPVCPSYPPPAPCPSGTGPMPTLNGAQPGHDAESFSCTLARGVSDAGAPVAAVGIAALVGLGASRSRRRRKR